LNEYTERRLSADPDAMINESGAIEEQVNLEFDDDLYSII